MLKIYSIPNMERFLSLVARSRGQRCCSTCPTTASTI